MQSDRQFSRSGHKELPSSASGTQSRRFQNISTPVLYQGSISQVTKLLEEVPEWWNPLTNHYLEDERQWWATYKTRAAALSLSHRYAQENSTVKYASMQNISTSANEERTILGEERYASICTYSSRCNPRMELQASHFVAFSLFCNRLYELSTYPCLSAHLCDIPQGCSPANQR